MLVQIAQFWALGALALLLTALAVAGTLAAAVRLYGWIVGG